MKLKFNNKIKTDLRRRKEYKNYEVERLLYKSYIHNLNLSELERFKYIQKLNELPKNSSSVRIKNRCILTGRGHSVLSNTGLSRIKFRELAQKGLLMGWYKASF